MSDSWFCHRHNHHSNNDKDASCHSNNDHSEHSNQVCCHDNDQNECRSHSNLNTGIHHENKKSQLEKAQCVPDEKLSYENGHSTLLPRQNECLTGDQFAIINADFHDSGGISITEDVLSCRRCRCQLGDVLSRCKLTCAGFLPRPKIHH